MKFPRNGDEVSKHQVDISFQWTWNGLHIIELWTKGVTQEPPDSLDIANAVDWSLHNDSKALFLKTTPTQLIQHGEVEWVTT